MLRVCWKARHRGARGQQLNHLCERVESDIKHLTWNGQRALNQQPKPLGGGGGVGAVAGEEEDVINKKKAAETISVGKN